MVVTFCSNLPYIKHQSRNKACSFTEEAEKKASGKEKRERKLVEKLLLITNGPKVTSFW